MNLKEAKAEWPVLLEDCYDYSIPPGWSSVVEDLMEALSIDTGVRVMQAKVKMADLRVYCQTATDDRAEKLINAADEKCRHTCEDCGVSDDTVKTRGGNWLHVRCEKCDEKAKS